MSQDITHHDAPEFTPEVWTFMGIRIGRGEKPYCLWLDPNGEELPYHSLKPLGAASGSQYQIDVLREAGTIKAKYAGSKSGIYIGRHEDDDAILRWETEHRAATRRQEALAQTKKANRESRFIEVLGPIATAYAVADRKTKRLILADVIEAITGGIR